MNPSKACRPCLRALRCRNGAAAPATQASRLPCHTIPSARLAPLSTFTYPHSQSHPLLRTYATTSATTPPPPPSARSFSTQKPQPSETNSPFQAQPPPHPDQPSTNASAIQKLAQAVRHSNLGGVTEPYVAYGATEKLIRQCASQADYDIPQVREKDGVVPKTGAGEDLGVGRGWWYE
ncbi:hypothetical protein LTR28_009954, partial [Elasticomyces elasticus]